MGVLRNRKLEKTYTLQSTTLVPVIQNVGDFMWFSSALVTGHTACLPIRGTGTNQSDRPTIFPKENKEWSQALASNWVSLF